MSRTRPCYTGQSGSRNELLECISRSSARCTDIELNGETTGPADDRVPPRKLYKASSNLLKWPRGQLPGWRSRCAGGCSCSSGRCNKILLLFDSMLNFIFIIIVDVFLSVRVFLCHFSFCVSWRFDKLSTSLFLLRYQTFLVDLWTISTFYW